MEGVSDGRREWERLGALEGALEGEGEVGLRLRALRPAMCAAYARVRPHPLHWQALAAAAQSLPVTRSSLRACLKFSSIPACRMIQVMFEQ